jgi:hypothetical protein
MEFISVSSFASGCKTGLNVDLDPLDYPLIHNKNAAKNPHEAAAGSVGFRDRDFS